MTFGRLIDGLFEKTQRSKIFSSFRTVLLTITLLDSSACPMRDGLRVHRNQVAHDRGFAFRRQRLAANELAERCL